MSAGCRAQLKLSARLGSFLGLLHAEPRQDLDELAALIVGLLVHLTKLLDMVGRLCRGDGEAVFRLFGASAPLLGPSVAHARATNVTAIDDDLRFRDARLLVRAFFESAGCHQAGTEHRHVSLDYRTDASRVRNLLGE